MAEHVHNQRPIDTERLERSINLDYSHRHLARLFVPRIITASCLSTETVSIARRWDRVCGLRPRGRLGKRASSRSDLCCAVDQLARRPSLIGDHRWL